MGFAAYGISAAYGFFAVYGQIQENELVAGFAPL
jgi:hypothetical protein